MDHTSIFSIHPNLQSDVLAPMALVSAPRSVHASMQRLFCNASSQRLFTMQLPMLTAPRMAKSRESAHRLPPTCARCISASAHSAPASCARSSPSSRPPLCVAQSCA